MLHSALAYCHLLEFIANDSPFPIDQEHDCSCLQYFEALCFLLPYYCCSLQTVVQLAHTILQAKFKPCFLPSLTAFWQRLKDPHETLIPVEHDDGTCLFCLKHGGLAMISLLQASMQLAALDGDGWIHRLPCMLPSHRTVPHGVVQVHHLMLDVVSAAACTSNYAASLEHLLASSNSTNIDATISKLMFVVVMFTASDAGLQKLFASIILGWVPVVIYRDITSQQQAYKADHTNQARRHLMHSSTNDPHDHLQSLTVAKRDSWSCSQQTES